MKNIVIASITCLALAACGSSTKEPETPADDNTAVEAPAADGAEETAAGEEVPAPETWSDELSMEQKAAFMKAKVAPTMAAVFAQEKDFGCQTCHGPDGKDPKEFLPQLTFKDGALTAFAEDPETSKFMLEKVVPAMAGVFGMEPYNPETQQGFGCGGCHGVAMN